MKEELIKKLNEPLPAWAIKPHPTKTNMTAIHPMAVIDRLNEAFGVGAWQFTTDFISCDAFIQKTHQGTKERQMFMSAVKGTLIVEGENIHIEQYGGSSNDDRGDALKGGATDALTKCASYLGVGASIYKGQGNVAPEEPMTTDEAFTLLHTAKSLNELKTVYTELPSSLQKDVEVIALKDELKNKLS